MDTLRFFLSVLTILPLLAAPLVLTPREVQRNVVTLVILLHFAGIITATLAAPPASCSLALPAGYSASPRTR